MRLDGACDGWSGDAADWDVGVIRFVPASRDPPRL